MDRWRLERCLRQRGVNTAARIRCPYLRGESAPLFGLRGRQYGADVASIAGQRFVISLRDNRQYWRNVVASTDATEILAQHVLSRYRQRRQVDRECGS